MSQFKPRLILPDSWAEKSHCPICGMIPLWVLHQQNAPDEMNCPRCGTAFRVENAGRHLYLTQSPPGYQEPLGDRWLSAKDIRTYSKQHPWQSAMQQPEIAETEPAPPSNKDVPEDSQQHEVKTLNQPEPIPDIVSEEMPVVSDKLVQKARELHDLGNSRFKVRSILMQTDKISPQEADQVLQVAFQDQDKKSNKQNRTLLIIGGILIGVCLCSVFAVAIFRNITSSLTAPFSSNAASEEQAPASQPEQGEVDIPFLSDSVESLLPLLSGQPPDLPMPTIQQGAPTGTSIYRCPSDSDTAAKLFGGSASNWTLNPDPPAWAYFSLSPTTLYVPNGLIGEILYLNDSGGGSRSAPGPVTVKNVNMLVILCE